MSPASGQHLGTRPAVSTTAAAAPGHPGAAASYLAIADTGNRRLDTDFDHLTGRDSGNLSAARADLRDAAAAERQFDRGLLTIAFPPATEAVARTLFAVNQSRAALATAASSSTNLRQLHQYEDRLSAANRPVEQAVTTLRSQLGLPPPDTS
jgi:hypothetical protein